MKLKARFDPCRDGSYGVVGDYQIGPDGTVEVDDAYGEWLLSLNNNAWDLVGAAPVAAEDPAAPEMTITNGDETINLMDLDKPELLAMAIDMELEVSGRNSAQTIRDAIMAHVTIEQ